MVFLNVQLFNMALSDFLTSVVRTRTDSDSPRLLSLTTLLMPKSGQISTGHVGPVFNFPRTAEKLRHYYLTLVSYGKLYIGEYRRKFVVLYHQWTVSSTITKKLYEIFVPNIRVTAIGSIS
ncbi:hypothetical protein ACOME3_004547 [Neoechinorhynchus agilis]